MTVKQMNEIREQEFRPGGGLLGIMGGGIQGGSGVHCVG